MKLTNILFASLLMVSGSALATEPCCDNGGTTNAAANVTANPEAGAVVVFAPETTNTSTGSKLPVAAPAAPIVATSNDTCMGSTSGSVVAMSFGFSLGSTWTDKNCVMLKNSRELWNMGMKDPAIARMCMDDLNRDALEVSGIMCPDFDKLREDRKARNAAK